MNSRDPFNIRNSLRGTSPSSIIQPRTSRAAITTPFSVQEEKRETSDPKAQVHRTSIGSTVSSAGASASGQTGMPHAVARNVPAQSDPQRRYEENVWASSEREQGRRAQNGYTNGYVDKIGSMFGREKTGLPMYKDKPYSHASVKRKSLITWQRFLMAFVLALILLYWWASSSAALNEGGSRKTWWRGNSQPKGIDWNARREKVRDIFRTSWSAYEDHAWGFDEYRPLSKRGRQVIEETNGMGWIIVNALDTLMIMNLTAELSHARGWISTTLSFDVDSDQVGTFEATTQLLGGLLSAHYLSTSFPDMAPIPLVEGSSDEDLYREKAADLADRVLSAFESPSEIPYANVNLGKMKGAAAQINGGATSSASAGGVQLELKYVTKLTGEKNYWETAEKAIQKLDGIGAKDGLLPSLVNPELTAFQGKEVRLGEGGEYYYRKSKDIFLHNSSLISHSRRSD